MIMRRIVLLLLISMLIVPMIVSCAPKDDTRTSDLGVSRSSLVSPDGWAYYSSADGLFKIRPDGKDKTLILDSFPLMFLINENRIYYIPYEKSDNTNVPYGEEEGTVYSIYSCKTDGSDNKFICEMPRELRFRGKMQMRVVDGWIYLGLERDKSDGNYDLYRMSIDGTGVTTISPKDEMFFDYSIDDDGWIYYITAGEYEGEKGVQLWRMHHDGKHTQQVMQEVGWVIDYSDNEIYYSDFDNGNIYAISFFGSEKRKIAECEWIVWFVKVIDDWVYYVDAGVFYKVRKDGSDLTEIPVETPPGYNRMAVRDNWLTYRSEDLKYLEMVRISDMYDTDDLYDLIFEDQLESAIRNLDMDDPIDQRLAERYENYEVRKYE